MELQFCYLPVDALTPYENNTRKHTPQDIEQIKESIVTDGFNDPIGVWGENNIVVEGHGRLIAAKQLGMQTVPCIRLDHLTDAQRRDYAIRHNRTAELSAWDFELLKEEIAALEVEGFDLDGLGFELDEPEESEVQEKYTTETRIPQYEPSGLMPQVESLIDTRKVEDMIDEIDHSEVSEEEKKFLRIAAFRHAVIDFDKVADYYASASEEMQTLMERSALVLIDLNDAIANGFTTLNNELDVLMEGDVDG